MTQTGCGQVHEPSILARPACQYADPIRRNLTAVRYGAMVHDAGADAMLLRLKLIRVNGKGWYDLTPAGRELLASYSG